MKIKLKLTSATLLFVGLFLFPACTENGAGNEEETEATTENNFTPSAEELATKEVIARADELLNEEPVPITKFTSERSEGGPNDFYSEGDYWWPDPENPDGPYIRRDGLTNPDNFVAHRQAMRQLNETVAGLVAAYKLTKDDRYAEHAMAHLNAFFLNPDTRMNPNLLYAQAIKGKVSGRGIGIIDTIHLIEVARAIEELEAAGYLKGEALVGLKDWFDQYATWMNTHEYGLDEKDHGNNHSTWWATQVAAFAHLTDNAELMRVARSQFKKLLSAQMDETGGFPEELGRTKPYNYTLFNLEGYSILAELGTDETENLWTYEGDHGSLLDAWDFMVPYLLTKKKWPYDPDVQYFDQIPIQTTGLLLAARAYQKNHLMKIWRALDPERQSEEVDRNFPVREPILWLP